MADIIRIRSNESEDKPGAIEEHPRSQDRFSRDRADRGSLHKLAETGHGRGMDDDLAEIGQGLDCQTQK